ncbi:MAG: hypothetical protein HYT79_07205 [Elusimicrobia bacterium]|nr:hypothetical protein [Elusimicrobiota bacterium]
MKKTVLLLTVILSAVSSGVLLAFDPNKIYTDKAAFPAETILEYADRLKAACGRITGSSVDDPKTPLLKPNIEGMCEEISQKLDSLLSGGTSGSYVDAPVHFLLRVERFERASRRNWPTACLHLRQIYQELFEITLAETVYICYLRRIPRGR